MITSRQSGFTLIELMLAIAIMGILAGMAMPSMQGFFDKKRLIKGTEAIYSQLQLARSEAIARSADIHVEFLTDGADAWDFGISQTADCTVTQLDPTVAGACFLEIDDGDGTLGEDDDKVLKLVRHDNYPGTHMIAVDFDATTPYLTDDITFDYVRGTAESGSIQLESDAGLKLRIDVSLLGRVSICSPAGADHVPGYRSAGCTDW